VKIKSLVVITLLVLACSAAFGQSFGFGLSSASMGPRCDEEFFTVSAPIAVGYDYLGFCSAPAQLVSSTFGWKVSVPIALGLPASGTMYGMADSFFDSFSGTDTGLQAFTMLKTKASSKKIGYMQIATFYGQATLYDYGFLTPLAHRPTKVVPSPDKLEHFKSLPQGKSRLTQK
jgi:hypothetical protein